jgi:RNA-binding protein YlmH
MGIGCSRDVLGDIIFIPEGAQFVADGAMESFILANLQKIGSAPVEVKTISLSELQERTEQVKIIKATVAALRLDAVAAAGYGVSRSHMADEIKSKNVKVNWQEAKNASQAVNEGDIISFRSRGRVEVAEIRGLTKKGRTSITLKRFI